MGGDEGGGDLSGGLLGRARGEGDGHGADLSGDSDIGVLRVGRGLGGLLAAVSAGDLERHGVLEDLGVALELDDEAVDGSIAEGAVDGPLVALLAVGDAGWLKMLVLLSDCVHHGPRWPAKVRLR